MPPGGEQAAALAGAHGPAGESELQVADAAGLAVADLLVGAPARRRHQRRGDVRQAGQGPGQRQRGRQLEGLRAARRRAAAQLRDPDRPVGGGPADRAVSPGHDRPWRPAQLVFGVPAEQVVLGAADDVQDAGTGVRRPQFREHRVGRIGPPVDPAVGLPARRTALPGDIRAAVIQRLRPVPAGREPGHGQQHRLHRGVRDLGTVDRALGAAGHRELRAGPDVTGVHLGVGLQHGDPPPPGTAHDRPVQRGRPPVASRPRVNDKTGASRPDVRRNRRGQHRRDDQIRVPAADPLTYHLIAQRQLDGHLVPPVGKFGMHPLRHAVIAAGHKQDPHNSPPPAKPVDPQRRRAAIPRRRARNAALIS